MAGDLSGHEFVSLLIHFNFTPSIYLYLSLNEFHKVNILLFGLEHVLQLGWHTVFWAEHPLPLVYVVV